MAPADKPSVWSITAPYPDEGKAALENAWRVGSSVVDALLQGWPIYHKHLPTPVENTH